MVKQLLSGLTHVNVLLNFRLGPAALACTEHRIPRQTFSNLTVKERRMLVNLGTR